MPPRVRKKKIAPQKSIQDTILNADKPLVVSFGKTYEHKEWSTWSAFSK